MSTSVELLGNLVAVTTTARRRRARVGRAPGSPPNRQAILEAARGYFERNGYEGATIRAIAAEARVDPALVHHYFGTKDQLLVAALELPINPREVVGELLAGDPDTIGERMMRRVLAVWGEQWAKGGPLIGLIRTAMTHEDAARMMREFFTREIIGRVVESLDVPQPRLRIGLVASQLMGLAMCRFIVRLEPIAGADPETLIACYAPVLQRFMTGPLPGDASSGATSTTARRRRQRPPR
jgi:AcrR family transcriptional regulator